MWAWNCFGKLERALSSIRAVRSNGNHQKSGFGSMVKQCGKVALLEVDELIASGAAGQHWPPN